MSYSVEFMQRHQLVPISSNRECVTVGCVHPPDEELRRTIQAYHQRPVRFTALDESELRVRVQRAASEDPYAGEYDPAAAAREGMIPGVAISGTLEGAPAVNLVNSLLNDAVRRGASDLHLQEHAGGTRVRYRIDGVLRELEPVAASHQFRSIAARIKVLAGLNAAERRRPQDGRFTARLEHEAMDVRVSCMPTIEGESLVLRLFAREDSPLELGDLGMPERIRTHVSELAHRSAGFLVICGPTGCGKTTTLHAALRTINTGERNIVTIEDPVEYHLPGIEQVQTNEAAGLTFDVLLRRVLRQDPDVIMVGEVRDEPTAALAARAALTGHLVFATLHAPTACLARDRLVDLGVAAPLLDLLRPTVLSQRLVRTRCSSCRDGCGRCFGTGLRGRTGLFGLLHPDGTQVSMQEDGTTKVGNGTTTEGELAWALTG